MMAIEQTLEAVYLKVDKEIEFQRTLWMITDSQSLSTPYNKAPETR